MNDLSENSKLKPPFSASRRSIRNYLLDPMLQLQLGFYTIGLTIVFSTVMVAVIFLTFERIFELVLDLLPMGSEVSAILDEYISESSGWLVALVGLYMIVNVVITVVFTHKMVGPTVAFRRHIANLIKGDYSSRLALRDGDAFLGVADDLNQLAEKLGNAKPDVGE